MALLGVGVLYVTLRVFFAPADLRPRYTLLALWIWLPAVAWGILGRDHIYPHHFILLYPAQHLAVGIMLSEVVGQMKGRSKTLAWRFITIGILIIIIWNAVGYLVMMRFVDSHAVSEGHGEPMHYAWGAAQQARELAQAGGTPVVVLTDGFSPRQHGGAAAFDVMLGDLWLYLLPGDAVDLMPAAGGVRIVREEFGIYQVSLLTPPEASDVPMGHLANGIDFLGVSVEETPEPGETLLATTRWRIWGIPPAHENYSFSVQLFGDDGGRWAQADMSFVPVDYWFPGDQYTWYVALPMAADAPTDVDYTLLVVMYTYPDVRGVTVLDGLGNPAGEQILIPLEAALAAH
jgi:hypothetical protein